MPVSKLKNISLLVLLTANLILLLILVPNRMAQERQEDALRKSLSSLYAGQGIALEEGSIPRSRALYGLQLTIRTTDQVRAVTALLGDQPVEQENLPGHDRSFRSDKGTCDVGREGLLRAELSGYTGDISELLEGMGFDCASLEQTAGGWKATQSVLDVPIFSEGLKLTAADGKLTGVEGVFYVGTESPARVSQTESMTAADALTLFLDRRYDLGWVGSAIISLEQGYLREYTASATSIRLVPVWKLVTDTESFFVDGLTGEITTVS